MDIYQLSAHIKKNPNIATIILYSILAFGWTISIWFGKNMIIGYPADPVSYVWQMQWVPFSITHLLNPFYTHYLNAPQGANYMWPAPPTPYILLLWPITALWGPLISYNFFIVLSIIITGFTAYLFFKRLTQKLWLAIFAGALFAFSPYMAAEVWIGHPNLSSIAFIPFMAIVFDEIFIKQTWSSKKTGLTLGGLVFLQVFTSEEIVISTLIVAVLALIILFILNPRHKKPSKAYLYKVIMWTIPFLIIPFIYVIYQITAKGAIVGTPEPLVFSSAPPASFFIPSMIELLSFPQIFGATTFFVKEDLSSYIGIPLIIFLYIAIKYKRTQLITFFSLLFFIMLILTIGPYLVYVHAHQTTYIPFLEIILTKIPFVKDLLPDRLGVFVDFFAVIIIVLVLDKLDKITIKWTLLILAIVLFWLPPLQTPHSNIASPKFFQPSIIRQYLPPHQNILLLPYIDGEMIDNVGEAWQAQADFYFRMPEGYWTRLASNSTHFQSLSAYGPALHGFNTILFNLNLGQKPHDFNKTIRKQAQEYFKSKKILFIVLGPSPTTKYTLYYMSNLLQQKPYFTDGVYLWHL